jgi:hypothetical protein
MWEDEVHQFAVSTCETAENMQSMEIKAYDKGFRKTLLGEAVMPGSEMSRCEVRRFAGLRVV